MLVPPHHTRPANEPGLAQADALVIALAVSWAVISGIFFWLAWPANGADDIFAIGRLVLSIVAVIGPTALILLISNSRRMIRDLRAAQRQTAALTQRLDQMQQSHALLLEGLQLQIDTLQRPQAELPQARNMPPGYDMAAQQALQLGPDQARVIPAPAARDSLFAQPVLALGTAQNSAFPGLARPDLIEALHFPDDEDDTVGFAALRRALRDDHARQLVQASQDVLTLLSQDDIYMDDLSPLPADPGIWRRFAAGERGQAMADVGAITDGQELDKVTQRLRDDAVFRDTAQHFQRRFDMFLAEFAKDTSDDDLTALAATRTAYAFMLLTRAQGAFD